MCNKQTNAHGSALCEIQDFIAQPHVKEMAADDKRNRFVNAASMLMLSSNPLEDPVQT